MANLSTTYLGIELANPVIVSSSGITGSIDGVRKCADSGAGAVVLKSLFEEIIIAQSEKLDREIIKTEHPEAFEYIEAGLGMQMGPKPYLKFIEEARRAVSIPVIASVNCVSARWWVSYAKDLESAGAQAIELNISHFPGRREGDAAGIEKRYADIVGEVADRVSIPVAVKVGFHFTALGEVLAAIANAGARGIVLFNRTYAVDVNLKKKKFVPAMSFSGPEELSLPLRWVGLAAGTLPCDISASTGIHRADGALKMIMAGASTVQVCSVLYRKGVGYLAELIGDIDSWLDQNNYGAIDDIRGAALRDDGSRDILLHRLQYLRALNDAAEYEF